MLLGAKLGNLYIKNAMVKQTENVRKIART